MNSDDISCEVAKLSKKISDHADEIYKIWKHCGLAPTEIFNCCKDTPNNIFEANLQSTTSDHHQLTNTEGLQRLVNSFVMCDKARNRTDQLLVKRENADAAGGGAAAVTYHIEKDENYKSKTTTKAVSPAEVETANAMANDFAKTMTITTPQKPLPETSSSWSCVATTSAYLENACVAKTQLFRQQRQQQEKQQQQQHQPKQYQTLQNQPRKSSSNEVNCETRRTSLSDLSIDYLKDSFFDCRNFRDELDIRKNTKENTKTKILNLNRNEFFQEKFTFDRKRNRSRNDDHDNGVVMNNNFMNSTNIAVNMKENLSANGAYIENNNNNNNNNNNSSSETKSYNNVKQDTNNYIDSIHKTKIIEDNVIMEIIPSAQGSSVTMPAPTKLRPKYKHLDNGNGQDKHNRPILTRGSVAERVLLFEKCPDVNTVFRSLKRPVEPPLKSNLKVKLHADPHEQVVSLQKELRSSGKSVYIPRFYFPHGKPQPTIAIEKTIRGILAAFDSFPNNQVTKDELPRILKICGLPYYWRIPVLLCTQQSPQSGLVERQRFVDFWKQMSVYCHDAASRFIYILSRGQRFRSYILPEDLVPLIQDVVDTHPGLSFLKEAVEFHSRYVHTVVARIFYSVNRSWSGKITASELKKSDLLEIINLLEEEDDINQIMAFFSYEHFYVIYCKFWELDSDHDLLISQDDLARHSDHALSTRIIERIFSGCVTRGENVNNVPPEDAKMTYTDFVWFLLSEEDKRSPTAVEYWFRCMDLDGDGILSMYELEYFYEEQQQRMESIGIETLPYEDCLCQMLDMVKPKEPGCVTLGDLKRCRMTHVFFDTFFNLEKYLDHEQRDPFAVQRDEYSSDWDRYAAQEYELLITEEAD